MAGASDPLEDMLFSEVDEKAVSDLVGSLESQLGGQRDPPSPHPDSSKPERGRAQMPAPGDSPSEPQQQAPPLQNARKAARNLYPEAKDATSDKHAKTSESVLKTPGSSIIIITATTAAASDALAPGNKAESPRDTRKKHPGNTRTLRSTGPHNLNGTAASAPVSTTTGIDTSTFTVSGNPQAIALDRGTPTIALHRLPRHIIASIAQKGNAQVNHSKPQPEENHEKPMQTITPPVTATVAPVKPVVAVSVTAAPGVRPVQTPAQQRLVTPQVVVRPPQPQATIQLPPGFTIPPELGQLVMVPQQALAQAQAQSTPVSQRPSTPTSVATFRVTTPQSPVSTPIIRPAPAPLVQSKPAPAVSPCAPVQTSSTPAPAKAMAVTAAPPSAASPVISQEMQENVKKCKNFLATLIKLASHNSPSPETSRNVKALVQDLLDAKIDPEEFTSRLQSELKSSPQPYLVPFLKKSLPALRLSLLNSQQSLVQPLQPNKSSVSPVQTGVSVRPHQPNSTTGVTQGIKRTVCPGGQMRMPVVITQTVRPTGVLGKPGGIQACRSATGITIQLSANQKNKLNDPGGGSFRDDDDINDVASMAGVNLNEESARILATNSELSFGVTEVPLEAVNFISHATQSRLRTVLEKVSFIAQHRMDPNKEEECCEQSSDVRSQLKFFEHLERMEKQRKDEREREILLRAAKSRSRQEDPEQVRLKQKAKEMQQQELAEMRQRDANLTALAAIGPRKKRKLDSPGPTSTGIEQFIDDISLSFIQLHVPSSRFPTENDASKPQGFHLLPGAGAREQQIAPAVPCTPQVAHAHANANTSASKEIQQTLCRTISFLQLCHVPSAKLSPSETHTHRSNAQLGLTAAFNWFIYLFIDIF
ncbi:hypothetical protein DNTS_033345 [Danionella cerebrum]|uniref:TAFH domain-containing protein n=1 Tax=Danionella cerebrum TaxID=2873325 RepID=A0A553QJS1_9TELE|nr:hypothetical protein DNTS_033345 [Danionella translucida]